VSRAEIAEIIETLSAELEEHAGEPRGDGTTSNRDRIMRRCNIATVLFALAAVAGPVRLHAQAPERDSSFHPYHVNYWVTGGIIGVGAVTNYLGVAHIGSKAAVSTAELQALDKNLVNSFDRWALNLNPTNLDAFKDWSNKTLTATVLLPGVLLLDKQIRRDWLDMLLIYMESISITNNIYEWSFLGPSFQNKLRPVAYYPQLPASRTQIGTVRNSFYSGHTASAATATFLMAKMYSDYHPEIGDTKYLLYAAAAVPPLVVGYLRVRALEHFPSDVMVGLGVGAFVGILIPELHRVESKGVTLGLYSAPESTGLALSWRP
jgi:membrane-associated phospholipid phosphatase